MAKRPRPKAPKRMKVLQAMARLARRNPQMVEDIARAVLETAANPESRYWPDAVRYVFDADPDALQLKARAAGEAIERSGARIVIVGPTQVSEPQEDTREIDVNATDRILSDTDTVSAGAATTCGDAQTASADGNGAAHSGA